jgi:hypothetical protein
MTNIDTKTAQGIITLLKGEIALWETKGYKPLPTWITLGFIRQWSGTRYKGLDGRIKALAWLEENVTGAGK